MLRWIRSVDRDSRLLALLALLLYAPGLLWGLPYATSAVTIRGWDVDSIAGIGVLSELHNLLIQAQPEWYYAYPLFHYLLLGFFYAPYMAYLWIAGGLQAPSAAFPYGFSDPVHAIAVLAVIARAIGTLMATGTVVATFHAARIIWDRRTGIIAALAMLLCGPMVYYAHTGNLDVPMLFWVSLCVQLAARIIRYGLTVRRSIAFGVLAAFAVATKDQASGALVPAAAFLIVMHWIDARHTTESLCRWQAPLAMVLAGIVAYAIANGILFRPDRFINHVRFLLDYKLTSPPAAHLNAMRPATLAGFIMLSGDVILAFYWSMGPVLLLSAATGIVFTQWKSRFAWLLATALAGYLALVILPAHLMQYRYALTPVLFLVFFAARLLALGLESGGLRRHVALTALSVGLAWLLVWAVDLRYQVWRDARYAASDWLARNAVAGDKLAFFGSVGQLPRIPPGVEPVRIDDDSLASLQLLKSGARLVLVIPDYSSAGGLERSQYLPALTYRDLQSGGLGFTRVAHFQTLPLFGRKLDYLPIVNPPVQIFQLTRQSLATSPETLSVPHSTQ